MASRRHEDQRPRNECQDDQEVSQLEAGYVQEQTAPNKKRGVRTLLHRNGPQLRHRFLRIAAVQRRTQSNRGRADPGYLSRCEHSVSRPLCRGQIAEGAIDAHNGGRVNVGETMDYLRNLARGGLYFPRPIRAISYLVPPDPDGGHATRRSASSARSATIPECQPHRK